MTPRGRSSHDTSSMPYCAIMPASRSCEYRPQAGVDVDAATNLGCCGAISRFLDTAHDGLRVRLTDTQCPGRLLGHSPSTRFASTPAPESDVFGGFVRKLIQIIAQSVSAAEDD